MPRLWWWCRCRALPDVRELARLRRLLLLRLLRLLPRLLRLELRLLSPVEDDPLCERLVLPRRLRLPLLERECSELERVAVPAVEELELPATLVISATCRRSA